MGTLCTAFEGSRRIAAGELVDVALKTKAVLDRGGKGFVLIFNDLTSELIEVDFRGTAEDVRKRLIKKDNISRFPAVQETLELAARGPGRPKLGVVAREVTLLPRHWEWLATQPGGASVALRKLVEAARRDNEGKDRLRACAGSGVPFHIRDGGERGRLRGSDAALFAGKQKRFEEMSETWPVDVREHGRKLAAVAFQCANTAN